LSFHFIRSLWTSLEVITNLLVKEKNVLDPFLVNYKFKNHFTVGPISLITIIILCFLYNSDITVNLSQTAHRLQCLLRWWNLWLGRLHNRWAHAFVLLSFVPPLSLFSHFDEVKLLTYHLYQISCIYIFLVLRLFWSLPGCSIILQVRRNRPLKTLLIDAPNYLKCVIFTYFHYTKRLSKYVLVCCNVCNTEQITSHMFYVR